MLVPTGKDSPKQMDSLRLVMISCSTAKVRFIMLSQPVSLVRMSVKFPEVL